MQIHFPRTFSGLVGVLLLLACIPLSILAVALVASQLHATPFEKVMFEHQLASYQSLMSELNRYNEDDLTAIEPYVNNGIDELIAKGTYNGSQKREDIVSGVKSLENIEDQLQEADAAIMAQFRSAQTIWLADGPREKLDWVKGEIQQNETCHRFDQTQLNLLETHWHDPIADKALKELGKPDYCRNRHVNENYRTLFSQRLEHEEWLLKDLMMGSLTDKLDQSKKLRPSWLKL